MSSNYKQNKQIVQPVSEQLYNFLGNKELDSPATQPVKQKPQPKRSSFFSTTNNPRSTVGGKSGRRRRYKQKSKRMKKTYKNKNKKYNCRS